MRSWGAPGAGSSQEGARRLAVRCASRPAQRDWSTRTGRIPASRTASVPTEAASAAPAPAAEPAAAAIGATAQAVLPPALQGGLVLTTPPQTLQQQAVDDVQEMQQRQEDKQQQARPPPIATASVAAPPALKPPIGKSTALQQQGKAKRRDRRRRLQDKKRAEAAAAMLAVAAAALVAPPPRLAPQPQNTQPQRKQQQEQARRCRRPRHADHQITDGSKGEPERQLPITPKDLDLQRWYEDATAAAEQAHRQCSTAAATGRRRRGAVGAAAAAAGPPPASLAEALQAPMQAWLGERLEGMGFQQRSFPPLRPLDATLGRRQRELEAAAAAAAAMPGAAAQEAAATADAEQGERGSSSSTTTRGSGGLTPCTTTTFARWAGAARGRLPLLASQWQPAGADGWDLMAAAPLLHEVHAAHGYSGAAEEHAREMIVLYEQFAVEAAGLPVVAGRLPRDAALPGAAASFTLEALVPGGLAVSVAAAHHLSDNYSRLLLGSPARAGQGETTAGTAQPATSAAEGSFEPFSQMGAGLEAALLGAAALMHGDDAGLRLPPALAPVQVCIVPLLHYRCDRGALAAEAERLRAALQRAGVRAAVDWRRRGPAGVRFGDSERRGVPLRLELGPRDLQSRTCVLAPRWGPDAGGKLGGVSTDADALAQTVQTLLDDAQSDLRWGAAGALQEEIVDVTSLIELREVVAAGKWARGPWAGGAADAAAVEEESGAELRCVPLAQPVSTWGGFNTCLYTGYQASEVALFARPLL
ncbi:proline-tRNA chloroplastic mitochondrial [Micractinium conductrix]|uniref:proline--tRNA ligase n=1 Tax=Micractinium conductrix TaxID=554055 RepID=A0A2P6V6K4_9CHLO|nr:proline-tRNA chloroplastic mitochondrial [Micractinium conductrix]|eukprot:PSC69719.1 proline-tRNA chloroplastic mitochondrial [Micractinium conductrix]